MPSTSTRTPTQAEVYALYAVVFFLPLFEAPKNIAVFIFVILWIFRCIRTRDWGGRWAWLDTISLSIFISAILSIQFGYFHTDKGVIAAGDILSYLLVFTAIRRTQYTPTNLTSIFYITIASTAITLIIGYYEHYILHSINALQLHSVGHVNHSAIFLALVIILCISLVLDKHISLRMALLPLLFFWGSLFVMSARGAIIPLITFIFIATLRLKPSHARVKALALFVFIVAATITLIPSSAIKTASNIASNDATSQRLPLANTSIMAATQSPFFGVGLNNFGKMNAESTHSWNSAPNLFNFDAKYFSSHAHNLYFNTLAERGLIGLIPLLLFILLLFIHIYVRSNNTKDKHTFYNIAIGAWIMVVLGGIFNTTLHHEHAMLSLIMIGALLSQQEYDT